MHIELDLPPKVSFLTEPYRYKVLYGGRGSGKSWSIARVLIILALTTPGLRILCCREVQRSIKDSVHRLLGDQIHQLGLGSLFEITNAEIRVPNNGSMFLFAGLANNTVDSIKSFENVNICWVEEGQTVSERSWAILTPTIRAPGSEIWISMNPELKTDPTYVRFVLGAPSLPGCKAIQLNYNDNPHFGDPLKTEMEHMKATDPDNYKHIWLGACRSRSNAAVFDPDRIICEEFNVQPIWSPLHGLDWGYADDPMAVVCAYYYDNTLWVRRELVKQHVEIDSMTALMDSIPSVKSHLCRADSARPDLISHCKRNGYGKVIPASKGPGSIETGVDFLRSLFWIYVHPDCPITYAELVNLKYKVDRITGDILPVLDPKTVMVETPSGPVPAKDHCLAAGTLITTSKGLTPIEDIRVGDLVATRVGFKPVLKSWVSGLDQKVYKIETSSGKTLYATGNHKIITPSGSARVDALSYLDCILSVNQNTGTSVNTPQSGTRRTGDGCLNILNPSGIQPSLGTPLKRVRHYIKGSQNISIQKLKGCVRFAEKHLELRLISKFSAPMPVNRPGEGHQGLMMRTGIALNVENHSELTSIQEPCAAVDRVLTVIESHVEAKVYDLMIADRHEFYANGILVSNCIDALRYALEPVIKGHRLGVSEPEAEVQLDSIGRPIRTHLSGKPHSSNNWLY